MRATCKTDPSRLWTSMLPRGLVAGRFAPDRVEARQLAEDPNLRMGFMSTERDGMIVERSPIDAPTFEAALLEAMAELREAFPERFRSFIAEGDGHTFILRDFEREVGGASVRAWITDMLEGGESWISVRE